MLSERRTYSSDRTQSRAWRGTNPSPPQSYFQQVLICLRQKIEEMRITIEDLESLKELNDELEENHIETEKQLHEDLESRDMLLQESSRKITNLEETCQDYELTISKFRELVLQLQGDLESLRAQTQTAQSESATAVSQTAAMMSLNLKLQSTASKNQARNVEVEIKSLEARESRELLGIVQVGSFFNCMRVEVGADVFF